MRKTNRLFGLAVVSMLWAPGTLSAQGFEWPEEPENLQVLEGLSGEELAPVMRGFTRALGVRCTYCHVGEEGAPLSTYDFASDDNEHKVVARTMLRMLAVINDTLSAIESIEGDGHDHARVNMWCHTCHRGRPRPMTLAEELGGIYEHDGADAALDHYEELRGRFYGRGSYDFGEASLNELGYEALGVEDYDGAVLIFRRNVERFPESGNVHDSLGEAYMLRGDRELAIESYERSLELDPRNRNAEEKLRELRGG
jgi:hypothetical protein